jgi:hypothetical protein
MNAKRALCLTCLGMLLSMPALAQNNAGQKRLKEPPAAQQPQLSTNVPGNSPVIGYLETKGRTIIIKAGPKGPVYSVRTPEGKLLFEDLSADQLEAKAPELREFLKTAVAGQKKSSAPKSDASLRLIRNR